MAKRNSTLHFVIGAVFGVVITFFTCGFSAQVKAVQSFGFKHTGRFPSDPVDAAWLAEKENLVGVELFGSLHIIKKTDDVDEVHRFGLWITTGIITVIIVTGILLGVLCVYCIGWLWPDKLVN